MEEIKTEGKEELASPKDKKILVEQRTKWEEVKDCKGWFDISDFGWRLLEVQKEGDEVILLMTRHGYMNRFKEG